MEKSKVTQLYEILSGMNGSDSAIRLHGNGGEHQRLFLSLVETVYRAARSEATTFTWPPEVELPKTR